MFVLRKLVMVVSVVIIAGTSNDQTKPPRFVLRVYIASAFAEGAEPNASTDEARRMRTHNLKPEFIKFSLKLLLRPISEGT